MLYQSEMVPPGTRFAVRITAVQTAMDTERTGLALDLLVRALAAGRVEVGAARTRGLGQVRLTDITRTRVDLADRDQVIAWLCGRPAAATAAEVTDVALPGDGRLGIEVTWSAVTPVMVRASTVNEAEAARDRAVDTVPLRTGDGRGAAATRVFGQGGAQVPRRTDRPHRPRTRRTARTVA